MTSKSTFRVTSIAIAGLLVILLCCCSDNDTGPESKWLNNIDALLEHNLDKVDVAEGLAGTVIFIEGNCMPGSENSCLRYPVRRVVHIHEYTHRSETEHQGGGFHKNIQTQRVAKVQTDAEGFFEAALPPGNYSLFIEEEGMFYANLWNSEGFIQASKVTEGDAVFVTLEITYLASF